jgi:hypothetical protein
MQHPTHDHELTRRLSDALAIARVGAELGALSVFERRDWRAAGWLLSGTLVAIVTVMVIGTPPSAELSRDAVMANLLAGPRQIPAST